MAKNNKSAKDITFDKEREKFRSEIRNLKYQIQYRDKQIEELGETVRQREEELFKLNEWIESVPMANIVEKLEELKEKGYAELAMLEVNELIDKAINIVKQEINKEN